MNSYPFTNLGLRSKSDGRMNSRDKMVIYPRWNHIGFKCLSKVNGLNNLRKLLAEEALGLFLFFPNL